VQICAAHWFLKREQRTTCTCCVLVRIALKKMVINFRKPAYLMCLTRTAPWNWLMSLWRDPLITWSPFNPYFIFSFRLLQKPNITMIGQTKKRWHSSHPQTTLVTRVWKKSLYTHFAPPHPWAMLTKHCHLTQVCILPFSNIEWGSGVVDVHSVGIMIVISWFWHFPTQIVHDCRLLEIV